jgi:predicted RNA-binding Zn-ribbon protein involved in translation (DUF1610 family)
MKNIYDFLAKFKTYLNQKFKNNFWIDPKHTPYGNLLVKSLLSDKKIILKPIDSTLPIGSKRIQDFIINTPTFKKNSIDHYIFIARSFKENAIKLSKSNKQLTLITYDFGTNNIMLIGSENLDKDILKAINEFSKYFDSKTNKIDRNYIDTKTRPENRPKSLINTERTHRENEDQLYFLCPMCGVNLSVPKKYRKHDELKCYSCHVTFKNPIFYPNDKTDYKKINSLQNKSLKSDRSIDGEQLNLTKHQKNWFFGIIIFVVILIAVFAGILYEPSGINKKVEKPFIEKHEIKRSPEIIYSEIKKAVTDEYPGTCKNLFNEMKTDHPNSILFDSVKIIYDSAMQIVQLKKEEARKKRKIYEANKQKEKKQVKSSKYLKVYAQAYSDGILSCNVYLADKSGNIHYLNANSISYSIYDFHNNRIKPTGNISKSNTSDGLYIDIPLGTNVFKAKSISFVIKTTNGITYKSNSVSIDF